MNLKAIIDKLLASQHSIILTHVSPDPDALGSSFAMKLALEKMGKQADVILYDTLSESLDFMKNEYLVFDANASYSCDLLICLDSGSRDRLDVAEGLLSVQPNSVNIDHHKDNTQYAAVNHVEGGLSSTGEILFRLLSQMGLMDKTIAFYLYAAICADTGGFRYTNTTPTTMRVAADLMELGIDFRQITRNLFELKDGKLMKLEAELMQHIERYAEGKVSCVSVTLAQQEQYHLQEEEISSIVNIARNIRGVCVAASFKETEDKIKVSLRSECEIDVGKIAGLFGGGGHAKAAGIGMKMPLDESKKTVIDACIEAVSQVKSL